LASGGERARWIGWPLLVLSGVLLPGVALGELTVLHEQFEPDPEQDLALGATTLDGLMPAAVRTRSGVVPAPDPTGGSSSGGVYRADALTTFQDASFRLDGLTMRPERVSYADPFRPLSMPFKRLYAFDRVLADWSLGISAGALRTLTVSPDVQAHEDVFYADFQVELSPNVPVRVPTIGPGARLLALATEPVTGAVVLEDPAGNWFLRGEQAGSLRVVYESAIDRDVFGGVFPQPSWDSLRESDVQLPANVQPVAERVLSHIGVTRAETPAHALRILVDYFRRFRASDEVEIGHDPAELYLNLSLERKGVCRHRAYAFMVTALALGIPTRLVHNEAHAWIEVFGGTHFHRIDLGGAAVTVHDFRRDPGVPDHRLPPDAFSWPAGADPGSSLLGDAGSSSPATIPFRIDRPPEPDPVAEHVDITIFTQQKEILRGAPLTISGRATKGGRPCPLSRIDLVLETDSDEHAIGSVATNRDGDFLGHVTVPADRAVGSYQLVARLGAGCD
jgi:hypothetical protein